MTKGDDISRQSSKQPDRQVAEGTREGVEHALAVEVSLRKEAEQELESTREHLHLMITGAKDYAFFMIDLDGRVVSWNAGAKNVFGYAESEILGQPFARLFTEEDREAGVPERELKKASEQGAADDDRWHLKKDGSRFWAHGVTTALENNKVQGHVKLVRDMTAQKQAEERVRQSEKLHRSLIEQVKDYAIFRTDVHGRATTWNKGVERVLGFKEDEFLGVDTSTTIFTPEAIRDGVPQRELEKAATSGVASNDRWMMKKDGTRFYAEGVTTALRNEAGELTGFTKVMRDQTRQKQQADELAEKSRQLAVANEQKDHFLALLSHELRNPLAPIRTAADLICAEVGDADPVAQEACEILVRQVDVMTRLVSDLLDASRITSGKVRLRKEVLDLRDTAERAVTTVRSLVQSRSQQLSVSLPGEPVPLEADAVRIEQVIVNLLTNAAKYTDEGGGIWLTVERDGDQAVVRVRDNGEGIDPDMLPSLFTLFSQADRSSDHSQGGLGIGLALVRSLTELHGGTVHAHSDGLGKGSEFVVRLPLSSQPLQPSEPAEPGRASTASLRVLVVDDNADAARLMSIMLRTQGYEVRAEHSGEAALETAEKFRPHAIILDIGMPGMDGYELARRLREHPDLKDVRLVAVSGYGRDVDRQRSREAGVDRHLVKPVEQSELSKLLKELLPAST